MRELSQKEIKAVSGGDEFGGLPPSKGKVTPGESFRCGLFHGGDDAAVIDCLKRAKNRFA